MASLSGQIHRIRRARRKASPPPTRRFERYEPEYRALLTEMNSLCGDEAMADLTTWMVDRIRESGRLPSPGAVRVRARDVCDGRDVDVPADSPFRE